MRPQPTRLLLDEMFSPRIAEELRRRGHDVVALVADPELRSLTDPDVLAMAGNQGRRLVTENVKDFRPLAAAGAGAGLLLTSSRSFPRRRTQIGLLIEALDQWLNAAAVAPRPAEDWLDMEPPDSRPGPASS